MNFCSICALLFNHQSLESEDRIYLHPPYFLLLSLILLSRVVPIVHRPQYTRYRINFLQHIRCSDLNKDEIFPQPRFDTKRSTMQFSMLKISFTFMYSPFNMSESIISKVTYLFFFFFFNYRNILQHPTFVATNTCLKLADT